MRLVALDRSVVVAILALCPISVGQAQSPADFYKGKNIDLYIGYSAGGGYDVYARSLARHMGRFIPGNPTIVPKNICLLYTSPSPRDGLLSRMPSSA